MGEPDDLHARYLRQILLPEIGERGQRAILGAIAEVSSAGLAGQVAERYARAAGFPAVAPAPVDTSALAPEGIVPTPAAREVLAGARTALRALRRAVASKERA